MSEQCNHTLMDTYGTTDRMAGVDQRADDECPRAMMMMMTGRSCRSCHLSSEANQQRLFRSPRIGECRNQRQLPMLYQGCQPSLGGPFRWCRLLEFAPGVRREAKAQARNWILAVAAADVSTTSCVGDLGGGLRGGAALWLVRQASTWCFLDLFSEVPMKKSKMCVFTTTNEGKSLGVFYESSWSFVACVRFEASFLIDVPICAINDGRGLGGGGFDIRWLRTRVCYYYSESTNLFFKMS